LEDFVLLSDELGISVSSSFRCSFYTYSSSASSRDA